MIFRAATIVLVLCSAAIGSVCSSPQTHRLGSTVGDSLGGIVVQLVSIDDTGIVVETVRSVLTAKDGSFPSMTGGDAGSSILYRALVPSQPLRAFSAVEPVVIDAISEALVTAVLYVTQTPGGRTLTDFTNEEIRTLSASARELLLADTALDMSDPQVVVTALIEAIGRDIADAAGGTVSARPSAAIVGPDALSDGPAFNDIGRCTPEDFAFVEGDVFLFDVLRDGSLCNVEASGGVIHDAFDGGPHLRISPDTFSGSAYYPGRFGSPTPSVVTEDARELAFGPVTTDSGKLEVTRKVFVLRDQDVVRYLEVFRSISDAELEIEVSAVGDLGLDDARLLVSENDLSLLRNTSDWGAYIPGAPNTFQPTVGVVINGELSPYRTSDVRFPPECGIDEFAGARTFCFTWSLTIPPGGVVSVLHYWVITVSTSAAELENILSSIHVYPDMEGLSATEFAGLVNFVPAPGNMTGEAGSVASFASLELIGGDASSTPTAARDGSFRAFLDASAGDTVVLRGSDGTDTNVLVE